MVKLRESTQMPAFCRGCAPPKEVANSDLLTQPLTPQPLESLTLLQKAVILHRLGILQPSDPPPVTVEARLSLASFHLLRVARKLGGVAPEAAAELRNVAAILGAGL